MKKHLLQLFFSIILTAIVSSAFAATITANASGPWKTPGTWIGGVIPAKGDIAIIPSGITVTYACSTANGDGGENWSNPFIYVSGVLIFTESAGSGTSPVLDNRADIYVLSGGVFEDNTSDGIFTLPLSSTHIYFFNSATFKDGSANSNGNTVFQGYLEEFTLSPGTTILIGNGTVPNSLGGPFTIKATGSNADGIGSRGGVTPTNGSVTQITATPPLLTTLGALSIGATSATLGGNISLTTDAGSSPSTETITERGVVYQSNGIPNPIKDSTGVSKSVISGSGTGPFSQSVTGLSPSTAYHYRAYAVNAAGINYGADASFTTPAQPTITSATYNAGTGVLAVTGANWGSGDTIDPTKLTVTGEGGATYTLTTGTVTASSTIAFSVTLNAADIAKVNTILNKNGASSTNITTYNLAAAANWDGALSAPADLTGNGITVSSVAVPSVTSATYDESTGTLVITGTGFLSFSGAANDIVANKFTFTGEGSATYTLTNTPNVDITSGTAFTLTLSATDKAGVNQIFNKNGTSSTGATTYNLAAAASWDAGDATGAADLTGNGITVSNVAVPAITSAIYNESTGGLVVTGTGFLSFSGAGNDIVANKFTFTGDGGSTYTLTNTPNAEITNSTSFTLTLSVADKAGANQILNKNGTSSTGTTTYNLAAAASWDAGDATGAADLTSNGITVSNVAVPAITSTTYDATSGALVVTGTGFLSSGGAANDIVANKFTFTGEGGSTYTLTNTPNADITSAISFTLTLSAADIAGVNPILNKNGTSSTGNTTYNLAAAASWDAGDATGAADLTSNGITVSNVAVPAITSATYNGFTGVVVVTGTEFLSLSGSANDIVANKFTFTGEGGITYTLTNTPNTEITSGTAFTLTLSGADKAGVNQILNKNGTSSTGATTYNLAAAASWDAGDATGAADLTGNGITVSNVVVPAITLATYNASTGALVVTGTGFLSLSGAANDIVANKFTFTGEGGSTYTLTNTTNAEITNSTSFTLTLSAADIAGVNTILNKNGTSSTNATTYNLAAATSWDAGDATGAADNTNTITVSNVAVPAITSATYNASTGALVVTGTGCLSSGGAANDIVANKFTFTGDGSSTYTLTTTPNADITSGTAFTLTLGTTDKAAVNTILNKNGTSSTGNTTYNLAAAASWDAGDATGAADLTGHGITVTNVAVPAITSAIYNAFTGVVVVTGTGFLPLSGSANDIVANKFTFTGEGGFTYTLTNTPNTDITSSTSFTLALSATDVTGVNGLLDKNGTSALGGATYKLAAAASWDAGDATGAADLTGNGITATNEPVLTVMGTTTAFSTCVNSASTSQSFIVAGSNLESNITVTAPTGFEVSLTSGGGYGSSVTLTPSAGTVTTTPVFVRMAAQSSSPANGIVSVQTTGVPSPTVSVRGTVNSPPTITLGTITSVSTSATTFSIPYTATTNSPNQYSITTGATALPSFSAVSNTALPASPISVTIPASGAGTYNFNLTVTNSTTGCVSATIPFTLTINLVTPPTVTTSAAAGITTVSATLGNDLTSTGGLTVTDEGVVYSATNTIPTLSDTKLPLGTNVSSPGSLSGAAAGLSPNTTYYVAAYATNAAGTSYGSPVSFTTDPPSTDASLAGLSITPGALSPVFDTGTVAYTDTVANSVTNVTITAVTNNAFATVTMLTNGNQLSNGATATVPVRPGNNTIVITITAQDGTTQSVYNLSLFRQPGLPVLTTSSPGSITSGSAIFGYDVSSTGGATLTDQGIVYSTSNTSPTTADTKVPFANQTGTFFQFSSGLQAGTTYYAAAYATNAVGTAYGSPVSFTTLNTINSITAASSNPTNAASVNYTVTFANNVTGLSAANFTVTTTGTISGASVTAVNGSGAAYTVTVNTGTGDGTLTLNLDNAVNLSPGVATALPFAGDTYTIDKTPPTGNTISITSSDSQGASIAYIGDVVVYSFALSETPSSTPTVAIDGQPADAVYLVNAPANAYEGILNMQPSYAAGNVVGIATVTDAAGNTAQISSASGTTTVTYNNTPSLTVTGIFGAPETFVGTPGQSEMFTVSGYNLQSGGVLVTAPEGYEVSLDNSSFSSSGTVGSNNIVAPTNVYIRLSGVTAGFFSGNIVLSNGAIDDVLEAVSTNETISALMSISAASPNPSNAASVDYTAKFISGISGLSASNFTITTTGSITGASVSSVTGSGGTYTVTVNTGTGDGTLTLNLASGPVDNQLPFAGDTYTIDKTAPAASPVTFTSNNTNTAMAGVGDAVTLNFTTSEAVQVPVVTIAGHSISSTLASSSGNNYSYTAQYTVQASDRPDANGDVPYEVDLTDIAGNTASFTGLTTGVNVAFIPPSANALLTIIKLSPYSSLLNTGTISGTTTYTTLVSNATTSVTVTPTAQDANAVIKVNGITAASGTASGDIALAVGQTVINTVVTAQDGTTIHTYSITVTRATSGDALLSTIKLSPYSSLVNTGTVDGTTTYTTSVSNATASVAVIPTTQDATATIKVNGVIVTSGTASGSIALPVGQTTINTVVMAQNGTTTRTYSIVVTRAPSNNALLSTIKLTPASTLTNTGTAGSTTTYTTSVSNATASVTVTPTAQDGNVVIAVNGITVMSGTASGAIALAEGTTTTITTSVTAQDGTTTRTYSITVTRAPSNNALLSIIKLTPASTLTNTGTVGSTTTYTTSVSNATASVTVTPTAQDANAVITVNGLAVASGMASGDIALAVGQTTINTVVTAQDGITTRTYAIIVTRAPSSDALLSVIRLTPASILTNTGTTGGTTMYTTSVGNATTSVTVTPTAQDANATIAVNGIAVASGTASGSIALAIGDNAITTSVTAQDGTTTHIYSIIVTRAAGPLLSLYQPMQPVSVVKPADTVTIESDGIIVHQGISPNGDGINDFLTIDGILAYPDNSLQIIDRNGTLIYRVKGYNNITKVFDGHSGINGRMQQPGTYFYSLDYVAGGQARHKTGYIILKY